MYKNLQLIKKAIPKLLLAAAITATSSFSAMAQVTPVEAWGDLKVSGKDLKTEDNKNVVLRGMSFGWTSFPESSPYYTAPVVTSLAKNWKATVVRAVLGIAPGAPNVGAEAEGANGSQENMVNTVVQAAIDNGIYVIIDWHVHDAVPHEAKAIDYFRRMAEKWGSYPNVLFEIWNEPTTQSWSVIKGYAEKVIPVIRAKSNNVIIVGTRNWSQAVSEVIANPITSSSNIMYTVHFYAADAAHQINGYVGQETKKAVAANIPVFVTEYGTVSPDGNGAADKAATEAWYNYMDQNNISYVGWQINNKAEGSSALPANDGNINTTNLTASGKIMKDWLIAKAPTNLVKLNVTANEDVVSTEGTLVSPNPSNSNFSLNQSGEFTYTIVDIAGKVISSGKGIDNAVIGNELAAGSYFLTITTSKGNKVVKLMKN